MIDKRKSRLDRDFAHKKSRRVVFWETLGATLRRVTCAHRALLRKELAVVGANRQIFVQRHDYAGARRQLLDQRSGFNAHVNVVVQMHCVKVTGRQNQLERTAQVRRGRGKVKVFGARIEQIVVLANLLKGATGGRLGMAAPTEEYRMVPGLPQHAK